ncbi:hypothetical protein Ccel01_02330 [Cellulosimicrobium cellulans]|uniref:Secreted protein n=1 Tax=Cellulosimicrobium cellulans TaxID=1710 RepID=A0AAV5P3A8_CELCE|nr:hypothetical protein Ccel01_02330 [Cellulosimicrobium cellulans]
MRAPSGATTAAAALALGATSSPPSPVASAVAIATLATPDQRLAFRTILCPLKRNQTYPACRVDTPQER